jgi:sugar lactone lactonase YvrE
METHCYTRTMPVSKPLICLAFAMLAHGSHAQRPSPLSPEEIERKAQAASRLKTLIESSPRLPLVPHDLPIHLPTGQELGKVSWIAHGPHSDVLWLIQRGDKADPVLAVDSQGRILHSFGKGLYTIPHAIRLDPTGNIWTVDAASSHVIQYTPDGKELQRIEVGGQPDTRNPFKGTTDIAFTPHGRIFITDGYGNARVLEYTAQGKLVHAWGTHGTGASEFDLPHSIVVDENNILYVADRENGRIEKFDLEGKFLGEIPDLGRTYSLALAPDGTLWAGMAPRNQPTGAPGWIVKLDRRTGKVLGYVPVAEQGGLHTVEDDGHGHPITTINNRVVLFTP